jgi:hypothetical protein
VWHSKGGSLPMDSTQRGLRGYFPSCSLPCVGIGHTIVYFQSLQWEPPALSLSLCGLRD